MSVDRTPRPDLALRVASPREVAIRILRRRFGLPEDGTTGCSPAPDDDPPSSIIGLAEYQADAVARARSILARRGGVIVADGVGLGKTFVALSLVERALRDGRTVAVTSPAALRSTWTPGLRRLVRRLDVPRAYGLGGRRYVRRRRPDSNARRAPAGNARGRRPPRTGRGDVRSDRPARPALAWFSHARLSRGTHRPERLGPVGLVVVDEAHAFRNPRTRRYRALAGLCVGSRVVLLTATPVNNSPDDLYALIRLFASDEAFRDVGVPDLREAFRAAAPGDGRGIGVRSGPEAATAEAAARGPGHTGAPPSLAPVLRAVVIRRTRGFLREHYGGIRVPGGRAGGGGDRTLRFPRRAPARPIRYASADLFERDDGALALVDAMTFAPLRWPAFLADGAATTPAPTGTDARPDRRTTMAAPDA
ncbi:MAG: SNF2-related protein, partial [Gemmatimonadota bacterium]